MVQKNAVFSEDELLISRFQRGDAEAFDRLMMLHANKIFALAWGVLQNREEAKDAVQEVFIKLHSALLGFPASNNLNAWLYRVCLNHCIDRKRRAKKPRVELTEDDWERLSGPEADEPEFRVYQSEVGWIIRQAVERLPERQRLVFVLRHYKMLSLDEIAGVMECTPGAVKAHLSRATGHLRDWLKDKLAIGAVEVD